MKVSDYVCIRKSHSVEFTNEVREWLKKGYELYGPPVMQVSPTLIGSRYGNFAVSGRDTYDYMQVLVKPAKEPKPKPVKLPVIQGAQNCADCSCGPALAIEGRSCGRVES